MKIRKFSALFAFVLLAAGSAWAHHNMSAMFDFNQVVTPDLAVRANVMYHQSDVAGRDFVEDERWGGLISATARVTEDVKVTLDYYRFRSDGIPDWGVPVSRAAKVPFTELGVPRDNFYGQLSLDYINDESDVGTATVEAKLSDNIKLTNKTRVGANYQAYIATAAHSKVKHKPADQRTALGNQRDISNPRTREGSQFGYEDGGNRPIRRNRT